MLNGTFHRGIAFAKRKSGSEALLSAWPSPASTLHAIRTQQERLTCCQSQALASARSHGTPATTHNPVVPAGSWCQVLKMHQHNEHHRVVATFVKPSFNHCLRRLNTLQPTQMNGSFTHFVAHAQMWKQVPLTSAQLHSPNKVGITHNIESASLCAGVMLWCLQQTTWHVFCIVMTQLQQRSPWQCG